MQKTNGHDSAIVIADRREVVAGLALRQMSLRRIAARLARMGRTNPVMGKPWTDSVVQHDFSALKREWAARAAGDIAVARGEHLAALRQIEAPRLGARGPEPCAAVPRAAGAPPGARAQAAARGLPGGVWPVGQVGAA